MNIHTKSIYKQKIFSQKEKVAREEDIIILTELKKIIEERPSYGYKRLTTMISHRMLRNFNKKRIYRLLKVNGLMLPKNMRNRDSKKTGKIMTLFSNLRWCSDCFEIKCFNGEKVYVTFTIDSCDREIISYVVKGRPILAEDIIDMMIMAVEKRFNKLRTTREIEFLSDRGSIYRAYQVQLTAKRLGLKSCFTAAYSPESNGMSGSVSKHLKKGLRLY